MKIKSLKISKKLHKKLRLASIKSDMKIQEIVEDALQQWLDRFNNDEYVHPTLKGGRQGGGSQ